MIWMLGTKRGAPSLRRRTAFGDGTAAPLAMPDGTSASAMFDAVIAMAEPGDVITTGRHRYFVVQMPASA